MFIVLHTLVDNRRLHLRPESLRGMLPLDDRTEIYIGEDCPAVRETIAEIGRLIAASGCAAKDSETFGSEVMGYQLSQDDGEIEALAVGYSQ